MRRSFTISIAILYLIVSFGMILGRQYCGKRIVKVNVYSAAGHGCCGKVKKSCCRTEVSVLKVTDSHGASADTRPELPKVLTVLSFGSHLSGAAIALPHVIFQLQAHSPSTGDPPVYLACSNFRI